MSVLCVITTMIRPWRSRITRKCASWLSLPRSEVVLPPTDRQNWMLVICGTASTVNWVRRTGSSHGTSSIGYSDGGSTRPISALQCSQAARSPEVVDPQEAAFQQIVAKPLALLRRQADGADVGGHRERAVEERRVGEAHDPVVRLSALVAADRRLGQLRQPGHQVDLGVGIVGHPSHPHRFGADALVHDAAEREVAVRHRGRRKPRRDPAFPESPRRLRVSGGTDQPVSGTASRSARTARQNPMGELWSQHVDAGKRRRSAGLPAITRCRSECPPRTRARRRRPPAAPRAGTACPCSGSGSRRSPRVR